MSGRKERSFFIILFLTGAKGAMFAAALVPHGESSAPALRFSGGVSPVFGAKNNVQLRR